MSVVAHLQRSHDGLEPLISVFDDGVSKIDSGYTGGIGPRVLCNFDSFRRAENLTLFRGWNNKDICPLDGGRSLPKGLDNLFNTANFDVMLPRNR